MVNALFDVPQKFEGRMEFRQYTFKKGETSGNEMREECMENTPMILSREIHKVCQNRRYVFRLRILRPILSRFRSQNSFPAVCHVKYLHLTKYFFP